MMNARLHLNSPAYATHPTNMVSVVRVEQHVPEKLEISHRAWLRQPAENRDRRFIFRETTKSLITDVDTFDCEFSLRKLQRFPFEAKNKVQEFDLHTIFIIASVYLHGTKAFPFEIPLDRYKHTNVQYTNLNRLGSQSKR